MATYSMNKDIPIYVIILVVGLLIGFGVGFGMGAEKAVGWCVEYGIHFLDLKGIELDINEALLVEGIMNYNNQIGGWLNCTST